MRKLIIIYLFSIAFSQDEGEADHLVIQGEYNYKINNESIEYARAQCTELAIINAIQSYILTDEVPPEDLSGIIDCLRSNIEHISVLGESRIGNDLVITIQALISEEAISGCLY